MNAIVRIGRRKDQPQKHLSCIRAVGSVKLTCAEVYWRGVQCVVFCWPHVL
jgi:hypothetical protein